MLTKSYPEFKIRELIPEALITLDAYDRFVYVNQIAGEILKRNPEDLLGKHIWTEFPDAADQPVHQAYIKAMQSKQHVYLEEYNAAYDRWFENYFYQTPAGISISFRDITERKKTELLFKDNELKYKLFFENSLDGLALLDEQGKIYTANPAACKMFELTKEEMCVAGRDELFDLTDLRMIAFINERTEKGYAQAEVTGIKKDGTTFPLDIKENVFTDSSGKKLINVVCHDITSRKLAESVKEEALERLLKISTRLPGSIYQFRLRPDGTYCFPYASDNIYTIYQVTPEEIYNDPTILFLVIHPDDIEGVMMSIQESANNLSAWQYEYRVQVKDGTIQTVYANSSPQKEADGSVLWHGYISDITQRKESEKVVAIEQSQMNELMNNIPDNIYFKDLQSRFIRLNKAHADYFELTDPLQAIGKTDFDFFSDEHAAAALKGEQEIIRTGKPLSIEEKTIRPDGEVIWELTNKLPLRNREGVIIGTFGMSKDITERKLYEEVLRESEERWRKLVKSIPDFVALHDLDGKYLFLNHYAAGFSEKDIIGKSLYDFISEESKEIFSQHFEQCIQNNQTEEFIFKAYGDNKVVRIYESHLMPITDKDRKVVTIMSIAKDITDRQKAEDMIRASEERYRSIITALPDGVAITDLEGRVLMASPVTKKMFGVENDEALIGHLITDFIVADDRDIAAINIELMFQNMKTGLGEYRALRNDGTVFYIEANAEFLKDAAGEPQQIVFIIRDITLRKLAEEQLKESEHFLSETQRVSKIGSYKLDLVKGEWDCSRELKSIFGIEGGSKRAIDKWISYLHPDFTKQMQEYFTNDVIGKKQRFDREYKVVHQITGKEYWVHGIGDLEMDVNGLPVRMIGTIQDITEKKEAEELLDAKEKLFKALIENSNDGVIILDAWGTIKYVAPSITSVLGYTEEEVYHTNLLSVAHPDDQEELQQIFKNVLANPGLHVTEFIPRIKHKDGSWRWIAGTLNNLLHDPVINGIVENFRDVTEQVLGEQAIRESENKYHSLVENAGDAIAIYETSGKILDVNAIGINMLGYTKKEILQMRVTDFFTKEEMDSIPMTYNTLKPGESSLRIRNFRAKDTSLFLTEVRSQMLPDGRMLSIIRDVTERENARKQLLISNENYSSLVNTIEGIVWEADAKSSQFGFVSKQAEQILGYPAEQWITEKDFWPNHVHEADREWAVSYCAKYTKEKKSHEFEYRMIAADGRIVWLHDIVTVVVENDEPVKLRGLMIDITEKKVIEKGLEDYKFALNNSSIVDVSDSTGVIQYANENFCRISGYSLEELKGRDHRILKSGYHSNEHYKNLWDTITDGKVWRAEVKNKAKDGSYYWVDSTIIPFLNDKGKPSQFISIRSDITKRKEAETQILTTLERYDILSKATSDTIWDWDMPNNVVTYNQGITKNFGYKVTKVKNVKEWWDLNIHPDDRIKVHKAFERAFQKRKAVVQVEYRYRSADGNYKHILDRAFIIYSASKMPERMIGSMQDITNEKEIAIRIEKEVIDAQEREWNQIGMELHDNVNQILAASMLLMGFGKEKMERGQNAASIIHESEKHVGVAIDEIRRLSHQLAPVSVANLSLEQVFKSLFNTVNVKKQVKIKLQMKGMKEIPIPHKLQINLYRILQEQLNNIMKYAKASEVTVSFKKVKQSFVFKIADNGIGFDPDTHRGGIGLENIKRRAKVFSGEYKLKTAPGKGCEIIVEIPENAFSLTGNN